MLISEYFPCEDAKEEDSPISSKDIRRIYENIADQYSRSIFENRLLYSLTGDYKYISRIVLNTGAGKQVDKLLRGLLYIYGAGRRGKLLVETFANKHWQGFIDANKDGSYEGYPVYRLHEFQYEEDTMIVISNKYGYDEVKKDLVESKGVPEEKIIVLERFCKLVSINRYFEPAQLRNFSMHKRIFMDLGCYDGIDTVRALNFWEGESVKVCAMEPDWKNYQICMDNLRQYERITLLNRGIGGKRERRSFAEGGEGARFADNGNTAVEIDTIDNIVGGDEIGFIKMDIEGYEEEALLGGQRTIKRCRPVLAICIYHKRSDVWKIPLRILELNADYRFYLGHYTLGWGDTVLYAIDKMALQIRVQDAKGVSENRRRKVYV